MRHDFSTELRKIESVLEKILPDFLEAHQQQEFFGHLPAAIKAPHLAPLLLPCTSLIHLGGKRWRPLLLVLSAQLAAGTEAPPESAYDLAPLVEFVHTASLIHDDIEDSADTRRGAPAAHITYGLDTALNAGAWLYFVAPLCIQSVPLPPERELALHRIFQQELRRLHLGQAMDIAWHRDNSMVPSIGEYTAMVRMKTGTLASLAARVGVIAGNGASQEADRLGEIAADIGIGFQILDDVINLTTGNAGKARGDDIVEGKKSLPILLHLQKHPQDLALLSECFHQAGTCGISCPAVEQAICLVTESGAVDQAAAMAKELILSSCLQIEVLYPHSDAAKKISALFSNMVSLANR